MSAVMETKTVVIQTIGEIDAKNISAEYKRAERARFDALLDYIDGKINIADYRNMSSRAEMLAARLLSAIGEGGPIGIAAIRAVDASSAAKRLLW